MQSENFLNIDTPENVVFDYEVAGIGSRFMAALLDTLFIFILQSIAIGALLAAFQIPFDIDTGEVDNILLAIYIGLSFLLLWGYYIFFESLWNGQTPGKRWVGLRTLRINGLPINFLNVLIRNLIRIVDFMPFFYGAGVVTMFINLQSRRLGDLAAGTIVVFDRIPTTLEDLERESQPITVAEIDPIVQVMPVYKVDQLTIEQIETFLKRRAELRNAPQLTRYYMHKVYRTMGIPTEQMPAELDGRMRQLRDLVSAYYRPQTTVASPAPTIGGTVPAPSDVLEQTEELSGSQSENALAEIEDPATAADDAPLIKDDLVVDVDDQPAETHADDDMSDIWLDDES